MWSGPRGNPDHSPLIVWTFRPMAAQVVNARTNELINSTLPPSRLQHILDLAGLKWAPGREGYRKGRQKSAAAVWRWWQDWDPLDGSKPSLSDLATWFGVKSKTTASKRLDQIGQTWPPTNPKRSRQVEG
jgi:hypothetical protein